MLLISGSAVPFPNRRADLIAAALEMTNETKGDDGCLYYKFSEDLESGAIIGVEIWRDQAALDAHMSHSHTKKFLDGLDGVFAEAPVMTQTEIK
jgi:quinol monooxygenase YgiN